MDRVADVDVTTMTSVWTKDIVRCVVGCVDLLSALRLRLVGHTWRVVVDEIFANAPSYASNTLCFWLRDAYYCESKMYSNRFAYSQANERNYQAFLNRTNIQDTKPCYLCGYLLTDMCASDEKIGVCAKPVCNIIEQLSRIAGYCICDEQHIDDHRKPRRNAIDKFPCFCWGKHEYGYRCTLQCHHIFHEISSFRRKQQQPFQNED